MGSTLHSAETQGKCYPCRHYSFGDRQLSPSNRELTLSAFTPINSFNTFHLYIYHRYCKVLRYRYVQGSAWRLGVELCVHTHTTARMSITAHHIAVAAVHRQCWSDHGKPMGRFQCIDGRDLVPVLYRYLRLFQCGRATPFQFTFCELSTTQNFWRLAVSINRSTHPSLDT